MNNLSSKYFVATLQRFLHRLVIHLCIDRSESIDLQSDKSLVWTHDLPHAMFVLYRLGHHAR